MKNPNKDQFSLFSEPSEPAVRHDYGGGTPDEAGHEFPFVQITKPVKIGAEIAPGPSVTFDERALALDAMSKRYADYAEAVGFMAASADPEKRKELMRKYADLDLMAKDKLARSKYTPALERAVLMPLLKTDELLAAGVPAHEVEDNEQETIHSVRNGFGHRAGRATRNKNLRRIHRLTTKSEES